MKIKNILLISLILTIFVLSGCSNNLPIYNQNMVVNCKEGKYQPSQQIKNMLSAQHDIKIKHITINKYSNICQATAHLKKPIIVFGSEVTTIPVMKCGTICVERVKPYASNNQQIMQKCCE